MTNTFIQRLIQSRVGPTREPNEVEAVTPTPRHFQPCHLKVFGVKIQTEIAKPLTAVEEVQQILSQIPPIRLHGKTGATITTPDHFEVEYANRGDVHEIVPGGRQNAVVIKVRDEFLEPSMVFDWRALDAIKDYFDRNCNKLGLETAWEDQPGYGGLTTAWFKISDPLLMEHLAEETAKKFAKQTLRNMYHSRYGDKEPAVSHVWGVISDRTEISGFVGTYKPSQCKQLIDSRLVEYTCPSWCIKFAVPRKYLKPTCHSCIAVYTGRSYAKDKEYKYHLQQSTKAFIQVHPDVCRLITPFVSNVRRSEFNYNYMMADCTHPLLAKWICEDQSPSSFFYDFAYHINSDWRCFDVRWMEQDRDRKVKERNKRKRKEAEDLEAQLASEAAKKRARTGIGLSLMEERAIWLAEKAKEAAAFEAIKRAEELEQDMSLGSGEGDVGDVLSKLLVKAESMEDRATTQMQM